METLFDARRLVVPAATAAIVALMAVLLGGGAVPASAQEPSEERAHGVVDVEVNADRFFVRNGNVVAEGLAAAKVTQRDGSAYDLLQKVELQVETANNCRVLELHLAELYLDLLGLQVRTSTINLKVTGDRKGALGKLFCKLSEGLKLGKGVLAKRAAASLNRRLDDRPLRIVAFRAHVHEQDQEQQPATTRQGQAPPPPADACPVLDLLLGPLDLDLLGLVVELYGANEGDPIRVNILADPNGGTLGRAFCDLAAQ